MKIGRSWTILVILLVIASMLGACKGPDEVAIQQPAPTQVPIPTEPPAKPLKVALVLSGVVSDASWNAAAYNAINAMKSKYNIELQYTENVGLPDIEPTYKGYASKGFDVIIANGYQFGDPAVAIAKDYPNTKWGIVMGAVQAPNVASLNFKDEETTYLEGYLAAIRSKTGVIGGVGGQDVPSIVKCMEGYKLGAKAANPNIKVLITYTGTWTDPTAGYEAAIAQINNQADVILPIANLTSTGVYKAIKEKGILGLGSEGDQCQVAPGAMIGSQTDNIDLLLEIMMNDIKNDTYNGSIQDYGLKEGAVSFILCQGANTPDVETKLKDLEKQIVDGTIKVPVILEPTD